MNYHNPPLILTDSSITDDIGTIGLDDLTDPQPRCPIRLASVTPLMERLWRIALSDAENNIVSTDDGEYFGAGKSFGAIVYTRDISYSGILGLNALYPEVMLDSIAHTRKVRSELMFRVSAGYALADIDAPWVEEQCSESEFIKRWKTNSYTRRTDDVVWLWCTADLLTQNGIDDRWEWLYESGQFFFNDVYQPFFDSSDGLYFGQASFIDIHYAHNKASGYPQHWEIADCVMIKALSTNCLYALGLDAMALAAHKLGRETEALAWKEDSDRLRNAIRRELRLPDGTLTYFKDRNGELQPRRDALGCALAVLSGVAIDDDAKRILEDYPITDVGVPLFHPFFDENNCYHNNSSWPFVDTFFLKAVESAHGTSQAARNAALLARTCVEDGTFHEVVTSYKNKVVKGSSSQLWTAAAFIDCCRRARLLNEKVEQSIVQRSGKPRALTQPFRTSQPRESLTLGSIKQ